MIKIEIQDENVTVSQRGSFTFYEQIGWAIFKDADGRDLPHPERITISHRRPKEGQEVQGHKVGNYLISPQSFYKDRYNNVALGTLVLVPLKSQEQKAVA